jgi:hypothetical protein
MSARLALTFAACVASTRPAANAQAAASRNQQAAVNSVVGTWEAAVRSHGGIGTTALFSSDSEFRLVIGAMVDANYKLEGNQFTFYGADGGRKVSQTATLSWAGDTAVLSAGSVSRRLARLDRTSSPPTLVGRWRYFHSTGVPAYEEYSSDGLIRLRVPIQVRKGRYSVRGDTLVLSISSPPEENLAAKFALRGDTLTLLLAGHEQVFLRARELIPYDIQQPPSPAGIDVGPTAALPPVPGKAIGDIGDIDRFMQSYYRHPRPDGIPALIGALRSSGILNNSAGHPPVVGFFAEVFSANADRLAQWRVAVAKQDGLVKALLENAIALSQAGGALSVAGHSPGLNDLYWGAFFATGDSKFIKRLAEQLRLWDERTDLALFSAGATAKWSLASNARSHPKVRSALEELRLASDERTSELITELLSQGPERVGRAMEEIIRKQRKAGKWR